MDLVLSRSSTDTVTPSLFEEDVSPEQKEETPVSKPVTQPKPKQEVKQEPKQETKPAPKPQQKQQTTESPGSRKSNQEYKHEGSVEGLRQKYVDTSQGIDGFDDSIYLPNGEEVDGTWRLVDAFSVSPSHDPFSFHSTKGFPRAEGGGSANTRDYSNEPEAQKQVIELAGDFDGRALGFDSAVVVTKDGVVVSGNNRTMSSQLAARKGTDKKYIEALMKRCRSFGFTQEQVQAFEHPRVVFEIDSNDYSPEHFDKYNQSDKKEQTEEARIVKFSKTVKPQVLRGMADIFNKDFSWGTPSHCEELMSYFIKHGVISQAEMPKYFDGNKISAYGKQFITEYILGGVLNESVVRALYGEGMGNIKTAVLGSAELLLENWSNGSYAVIDELNKAVSYAISFVSDLNKEKFSVPKPDKDADKLAHNMKYFNQWASQGDLLEERDPVVLKLAGALVYSVPLFKEYLTKLNQATASAARAEREEKESGNAGLFGGDEVGSVDRSDLLQKAVASWNRKAGIKRNIFSSVVMRGILSSPQALDEESQQIHTKLESLAVPMDVVEFTRENYNKLFPRGVVDTPMGIVKMGAHQFEKLLGGYGKQDRRYLLGASKQVLNDPVYVVESDKRLYIKSFSKGSGFQIVISAVISREGLFISISTHQDKINRIIKKIKDSKIIYTKKEEAFASSDWLADFSVSRDVGGSQTSGSKPLIAQHSHASPVPIIYPIFEGKSSSYKNNFPVEDSMITAVLSAKKKWSVKDNGYTFEVVDQRGLSHSQYSQSKFYSKDEADKEAERRNEEEYYKDSYGYYNSSFIKSDLQGSIMKWTAQDQSNKQAYQEAMKLFRENFGRHPKSEKDAKIIFKTAKQMAKTGQVLSDEAFKQTAHTVADGTGGNPSGDGRQSGQSGSTAFQGGPGSSVPAEDPVSLFKAIRALYKGGQISKDQLNKAFQMVAAGLSRVTSSGIPIHPGGVYFYPDLNDIERLYPQEWVEVSAQFGGDIKTLFRKVTENGSNGSDLENLVAEMISGYYHWHGTAEERPIRSSRVTSAREGDRSKLPYVGQKICVRGEFGVIKRVEGNKLLVEYEDGTSGVINTLSTSGITYFDDSITSGKSYDEIYEMALQGVSEGELVKAILEVDPSFGMNDAMAEASKLYRLAKKERESVTSSAGVGSALWNLQRRGMTSELLEAQEEFDEDLLGVVDEYIEEGLTSADAVHALVMDTGVSERYAREVVGYCFSINSSHSRVTSSMNEIYHPILYSLVKDANARNYNDQGYDSPQQKKEAFINEAVIKGVPLDVAQEAADKYIYSSHWGAAHGLYPEDEAFNKAIYERDLDALRKLGYKDVEDILRRMTAHDDNPYIPRGVTSSKFENHSDDSDLDCLVEADKRHAIDKAHSGKNPGVRFDPLGNKRTVIAGFQIGSRVVYTPYKLPSDVPAFVANKEALYSGQEGVIKKIKSGLYGVEMPDGESVDAYGDELSPITSEEEILSARGAIHEPMRDHVRDFMANIPSLRKVPTNPKDLYRENLAPDHVCYLWCETLSNGKPYTVEFHTSPGESFADVYVIRDFDSHSLENGGFHIEDMEDWNLSEVDHVEGLITKELASTGEEATFDKSKQPDQINKRDYQYAPFGGGGQYRQGDLFASGRSVVSSSFNVGDIVVYKGQLGTVFGVDPGDNGDTLFLLMRDGSVPVIKDFECSKAGSNVKRSFMSSSRSMVSSGVQRMRLGLKPFTELVERKIPAGNPLTREEDDMGVYWRLADGTVMAQWDKGTREGFIADSTGGVTASFDQWSNKVLRGLSIGRSMGLEDMAIVSRLAVVLAKKGYLKSANKVIDKTNYQFQQAMNLYKKGLSFDEVVDQLEHMGVYGDKAISYATEAHERVFNPSMYSNERYYDDLPDFGSVSSGALDVYRKTLDKANKLTKNPLAVVDDLAELPFKALDKVTGIGSSIDRKIQAEVDREMAKLPQYALGYTGLFSGGKSYIVSALAPIGKILLVILPILKRYYPGFTWARPVVEANLVGTVVDKLKITFRVLNPQGRWNVEVLIERGRDLVVNFRR